jgi:cell shape-determining protein MreD
MKPRMNWLETIFILLAAILTVYWEAAFQGIQRLLGAQIDLLPPLMVYAGLSAGLSTVVLLALCGGLGFDSLSANPLGVSVLPLMLVGVMIHAGRELILRDQTYARVVLGLAASAAVPVLTLLLLLTTAQQPLLGWGTLWQLLVMTVAGAVATPLFFELFGWLLRVLGPVRASEPSFRPDREIRRGK